MQISYCTFTPTMLFNNEPATGQKLQTEFTKRSPELFSCTLFYTQRCDGSDAMWQNELQYRERKKNLHILFVYYSTTI